MYCKKQDIKMQMTLSWLANLKHIKRRKMDATYPFLSDELVQKLTDRYTKNNWKNKASTTLNNIIYLITKLRFIWWTTKVNDVSSILNLYHWNDWALNAEICWDELRLSTTYLQNSSSSIVHTFGLQSI